MDNQVKFPIWAVIYTHRGISLRIELFTSYEKAEDRKSKLELSINLEDDDVTVIKCNGIES